VFCLRFCYGQVTTAEKTPVSFSRRPISGARFVGPTVTWSAEKTPVSHFCRLLDRNGDGGAWDRPEELSIVQVTPFVPRQRPCNRLRFGIIVEGDARNDAYQETAWVMGATPKSPPPFPPP